MATATKDRLPGGIPAPMADSLASAPPEALKVFVGEHGRQCKQGRDPASAARFALRAMQHHGWYAVGGRWKRLAPNVRGKVNLRWAHEQPDGTHVIEGVDVFYPNAVKGGDEQYTADDIRQIIRNTNRGIASGGQKPALLEGHPNAMQAAMGTQLDALGFGVNWRESARGPGWSRCDLVDVRPEAVERLRARKLTGLSAGIATDAKKLNRRFGHVALLGGTTQALSHLPVTEIFSTPCQVCFSADPDAPNHHQEKSMPSNFAADMKAAHEKLTAAFAAKESGEPEADAKVREAMCHYNAACKQYESDMGDYAAPPPVAAEAMPAQTESDQDGDGQPGETDPGENVPAAGATNDMPGGMYAAGDTVDFAADPEGAFNQLRGRLESLAKVNSAQAKQINIFVGKEARRNFDAKVAELRKANHGLPPAETIGEDFAACFEARDPGKAIEQRLAAYAKLPKLISPATTKPVFSAADAEPVSADKKPKPVTAKEIKDIMGQNQTFSAEDEQWATLGALVASGK